MPEKQKEGRKKTHYEEEGACELDDLQQRNQSI